MKLSGLVARNMSGLNTAPAEASVASRSGGRVARHAVPPAPFEVASGHPCRS